MPLLDTHLHLWDLARFPYSWCAGIAPLNRSFSLTDYLAASSGKHITKALFMECDVDAPHALAEARHVQALASENPLLCGLIASARPESADFDDHLRELQKLPLLRGLRRVLHTQPDTLSTDTRFRENLKKLPALGLTFDLCVLARQLPYALALVEACPSVTFILDHCGVPDLRSRAFDPWADDLARLARLPNVHCKLSGLVAYADPATLSADSLRPWFDLVVASFGWDRLVWGGDWPVCTLGTSLSRWIDLTHELTASASPTDRAKLFHLNAEHLYRI